MDLLQHSPVELSRKVKFQHLLIFGLILLASTGIPTHAFHLPPHFPEASQKDRVDGSHFLTSVVLQETNAENQWSQPQDDLQDNDLIHGLQENLNEDLHQEIFTNSFQGQASEERQYFSTNKKSGPVSSVVDSSHETPKGSAPIEIEADYFPIETQRGLKLQTPFVSDSSEESVNDPISEDSHVKRSTTEGLAVDQEIHPETEESGFSEKKILKINSISISPDQDSGVSETVEDPYILTTPGQVDENAYHHQNDNDRSQEQRITKSSRKFQHATPASYLSLEERIAAWLLNKKREENTLSQRSDSFKEEYKPQIGHNNDERSDAIAGKSSIGVPVGKNKIIGDGSINSRGPSAEIMGKEDAAQDTGNFIDTSGISKYNLLDEVLTDGQEGSSKIKDIYNVGDDESKNGAIKNNKDDDYNYQSESNLYSQDVNAKTAYEYYDEDYFSEERMSSVYNVKDIKNEKDVENFAKSDYNLHVTSFYALENLVEERPNLFEAMHAKTLPHAKVEKSKEEGHERKGVSMSAFRARINLLERGNDDLATPTSSEKSNTEDTVNANDTFIQDENHEANDDNDRRNIDKDINNSEEEHEIASDIYMDNNNNDFNEDDDDNNKNSTSNGKSNKAPNQQGFDDDNNNKKGVERDQDEITYNNVNTNNDNNNNNNNNKNNDNNNNANSNNNNNNNNDYKSSNKNGARRKRNNETNTKDRSNSKELFEVTQEVMYGDVELDPESEYEEIILDVLSNQNKTVTDEKTTTADSLTADLRDDQDHPSHLEHGSDIDKVVIPNRERVERQVFEESHFQKERLFTEQQSQMKSAKSAKHESVDVLSPLVDEQDILSNVSLRAHNTSGMEEDTTPAKHGYNASFRNAQDGPIISSKSGQEEIETAASLQDHGITNPSVSSEILSVSYGNRSQLNSNVEQDDVPVTTAISVMLDVATEDVNVSSEANQSMVSDSPSPNLTKTPLAQHTSNLDNHEMILQTTHDAVTLLAKHTSMLEGNLTDDGDNALYTDDAETLDESVSEDSESSSEEESDQPSSYSTESNTSRKLFSVLEQDSTEKENDTVPVQPSQDSQPPKANHTFVSENKTDIEVSFTAENDSVEHKDLDNNSLHQFTENAVSSNDTVTSVSVTFSEDLDDKNTTQQNWTVNIDHGKNSSNDAGLFSDLKPVQNITVRIHRKDSGRARTHASSTDDSSERNVTSPKVAASADGRVKAENKRSHVESVTKRQSDVSEMAASEKKKHIRSLSENAKPPPLLPEDIEGSSNSNTPVNNTNIAENDNTIIKTSDNVNTEDTKEKGHSSINKNNDQDNSSDSTEDDNKSSDNIKNKNSGEEANDNKSAFVFTSDLLKLKDTVKESVKLDGSSSEAEDSTSAASHQRGIKKYETEIPDSDSVHKDVPGISQAAETDEVVSELVSPDLNDTSTVDVPEEDVSSSGNETSSENDDDDAKDELPRNDVLRTVGGLPYFGAAAASASIPDMSVYRVQDFSLLKPAEKKEKKKVDKINNKPKQSKNSGSDNKANTNTKTNTNTNTTNNNNGSSDSGNGDCQEICGNDDFLPAQRPQAAVSAVLTTHFGPTKDRMVPFDLELLDLADNYDNTTGMFICTIPGTYVISLYLMSHPGAKVNARVFINNRPIAALWADDAKSAGFYPSSSTQTIAQLGFGDQVYVMLVDGGYGDSWVHANYNVFTVFLLYEQLF